MSDFGSEAGLREHLSLFIECADQLHKRLAEWLESRGVNLRAFLEGDEPFLSRQKEVEQNILVGVNLVYREARRLGLETDPRPVLNALMPEDGEEGPEKAVMRAREAILALILDAPGPATLPGRTIRTGGVGRIRDARSSRRDRPQVQADLGTPQDQGEAPRPGSRGGSGAGRSVRLEGHEVLAGGAIWGPPSRAIPAGSIPLTSFEMGLGRK